MDREVWRAAVHGVTKQWTDLVTEQQQIYVTNWKNTVTP